MVARIVQVLERIKESGDIFWAQSDRNGFLTAQQYVFRWLALMMAVRNQRRLDEDIVRRSIPILQLDRFDESSNFKKINICFQGPSPKGHLILMQMLAQDMLMPHITQINVQMLMLFTVD